MDENFIIILKKDNVYHNRVINCFLRFNYHLSFIQDGSLAVFLFNKSDFDSYTYVHGFQKCLKDKGIFSHKHKNEILVPKFFMNESKYTQLTVIRLKC